MSDLRFGRERLSDAEDAGRLEWLVTNGIGGFASGSVGGMLTRRYHGLLVAALTPPLGRTLLLAKVSESLEIEGDRIELDTNRWASGAIDPRGLINLESFRLEDSVPSWTWSVGDTRLEKRVWMEQGENTTYVEYRLHSARGPVRLHLKAFVNHRHMDDLTTHGLGNARVEPATGGLRIEAYEGATPLWLLASGGMVRPAREWYRGFALARETERGLEAEEDHLCSGEFSIRLSPAESFTLIASTRRDAGGGDQVPLARASALARRRAHERSLLDAWRRSHPAVARNAPAWVRQLVLAADAFVVERSGPADPSGRTIIAGYPWFGDWGRDALIALPGLTLVTGRPEVARAVLTTFSRHLDRGMLPNYFPDQSQNPEYTSADASLWFFQAVRAYHDHTQDDAFLAEIYPALEDIGAWYERGTRHGIIVDADDGLLRAGEEGVQLTWMDAKVDDWIVTPRHGKPVELNALWYNALTAMATFAKRLKRVGDSYEAQAKRVERSFSRYWNSETGCLFDVLDGPNGHVPAVGPNQLLAVSLPDIPLPAPQRRGIVESCGRLLVTSHGLRSLSPDDPRYQGIYAGDRRTRDGAYHQGTAWLWLLPHYALAFARVFGDRERALGYLDACADLIGAYGVGMLPEIADGDPPHRPRGCIAQAWSVAEALRAYHALSGERKRASRRSPARPTVAIRA